MDWRTKTELFAQIRWEYEFGIGTIKGVALALGGHRRMVRVSVHHEHQDRSIVNVKIGAL